MCLSFCVSLHLTLPDSVFVPLTAQTPAPPLKPLLALRPPLFPLLQHHPSSALAPPFSPAVLSPYLHCCSAVYVCQALSALPPPGFLLGPPFPHGFRAPSRGASVPRPSPRAPPLCSSSPLALQAERKWGPGLRARGTTSVADSGADG